MRSFPSLLVIVFALLATPTIAQAGVRIAVDLNSQTMHVTTDSGEAYDWPVSTGRAGFLTPQGTFHAQRLMTMTYSIPYHRSPMPHSIFFTGGYAIHGTNAVGDLGRAASHGCVRLAPQNAALLFRLVRQQGASIAIYGDAPRTVASASESSRPHHVGRGHAQVARSFRRTSDEDAALAYAGELRAGSLDGWLESLGRDGP